MSQLAQAEAPQPVWVQGPDGRIVEYPPLPSGYKLDAPAVPPLPQGYTLDKAPTAGSPAASPQPGMFDDLIPARRPGMFDDLIPPAPPISGPDGSGRTVVDQHPSALHSLAVGTQGVGAGVRDIVLAPFDLMAGAQNLVTGSINKVFGTNIPQATPASRIVERVTEPYAIPESEMSPGEKLGYNVNRYGTQALGTGAMLAARAPAVAAQAVPSSTFLGRTADTLARPYIEAPARTLVGDTIGGAGAGVAQTANENYIPEHPVGGDWIKSTANVVAPLAGGMSANTLQSAVEGIGGLLRSLATKAVTSAPREIPLNPNTKAPYSVADVDRAAAKLQAAATGAPRALAQDIRENAGAFTNPTEEGAS